MKAYVRKAVKEDVAEVARGLRAEDALEVWRLRRQTPAAAVSEAFENSAEAWCFVVQGKPVFLFGVIETDGKNTPANIWALGTDGVDRRKVAFWRESRKWVDTLKKRYGLLFNVVDAKYYKTHKWLRALGAAEKGPLALGPDKEEFILFYFGGK